MVDANIPEQKAPEKKTPEKKNWWKKDWWQAPGFTGYKIGSVIIALLIWGFVVVTQNPLSDTMFTVPLEVRNLDSELTMLETTNQVQVRVQGTNAELANLSSGDIIAYVDMTGVQEGSATVEVKVEVPDNVQLVSFTPTSIAVELEIAASGSFPLEVRISGNPAENYTLLEPVPSPSEITLVGAADYLDEVGAVFVSADVSGLTQNYRQNLQIAVLDTHGNNITSHFLLSPSTATVIIPVVYDMPEKSVAVDPSVVGEPAEGYEISRIVVEPATVSAFGDLELLNSLHYLETEPIDISGLDDTYTQEVEIIHSSELTLSAESVTVVVQIEPVSRATFTRNVIHAQNLASGLSCDLPTQTMEVVVSGPETDLEAITANDIVPYLDFSGIDSAGEYTLPLRVTLPANISLVSLSPQQVTVTVTGGV